MYKKNNTISSKKTKLILIIFIITLTANIVQSKQSFQPENGEKFSVSPKIDLKQINENITKEETGKIQLDINNPGANSKTITTQINIETPEETEIIAPGITKKNTTYTATYKTAPKESNTITIQIESEKEGNIAIDTTINYWPNQTTEKTKTIENSYFFTVSKEIKDNTKTNKNTTGNTTNGNTSPTNSNYLNFDNPLFILLLVSIVGLIISSMFYALKAGDNAEKNRSLGGLFSGFLKDKKDVIHIPKTFFTDFMETRSESQFRPESKDVETVYALSGTESDTIDTSHKLSSEQVVSKSSPQKVNYRTKQMIEHISQKREEKPKLIVKFHTHPRGTSKPSNDDLKAWKKVHEVIKEEWPGTTVLFGIHAFSREYNKPKNRKEPEVSGKTLVEWRSLTRDHSVKVYDKDGNPIKVVL